MSTIEDPHTLRHVSLDDGRRVDLVRSSGEDVVEVRSPDGRVEVRVRLAVGGPIVEVEAAALQVRADDVRVDCATFTVDASEEVTMTSGGELHTTSTGDTVVRGQMIWLN